MTRLLSLFGLMRVSEHEAKIGVLDDLLKETQAGEKLALDTAASLRAKYKQAVADLEKQAVEIESLTIGNALLTNKVDSLRPDALAMRRKRQMDRDRRKGNG